jgi:hypothetical protein
MIHIYHYLLAISVIFCCITGCKSNNGTSSSGTGTEGNDSLEQLSAQNVENIIVFRENGLFAYGPSIAIDPGTGCLYTSFRVRKERTHFGTPEDRRIHMESKDGGLTWQDITKQPLNAIPDRDGNSTEWWDGDISTGGTFSAPDGALIRIGHFWRRWLPNDKLPEYEGRYYIERGTKITEPGPDHFAYLSGGYLERSENGGKSWQRTIIPELDTYASMSQRWNYAQFPDGTVIRAFAVNMGGKDKPPVYKGAKVVAVLTKDGKTCEVFDVLKAFSDTVQYTEEIQVHVTSDGTVWMLTRIHGTKDNNYQWQSVSTDRGRTWTSRPTSINVGTSPASGLVQLDDGRLLMVAGYRRQPQGIRAYLSDDEGLTWNKELVLRVDGGGNDIGYPRALQLKDGTILTIYWYHTNDDVVDGLRRNVHIACTRFLVPDKSK